MIKGLFDLHFRMEKIDKNGDPLVQLAELVDWELFREPIEKMRHKPGKSNAGRKPWDAVLMVKIMILQSLYNLSDEQMERQILDRLSFMRFLSLGIGDKVPDEKSIWLFRNQLAEAGLAEELFYSFDTFLRENGYAARKGQIVDASIVSVPKQRNSRKENERIKGGDIPEDWSDAKSRQKDTNARWVKKNHQNFYGYKNHIQVDVKHKFIRDFVVTDASVHDSQVFEELLDDSNSSQDVWADSAYRSEGSLEHLKHNGYREHLQRKGCRHRQLTEWEKQGNHTRAKTRCRIEHVFGAQAQQMGDRVMRCIGIARAKCQLALRNLAYNARRYAMLTCAA